MALRETSRWGWAALLVAADVTGLLVVGALAWAGVLPAALAGTLITGILAGSRIPAAVRIVREEAGRGNGPDDDPPPTASAPSARAGGPRLRIVADRVTQLERSGRPTLLVTGAIGALIAGLLSWGPWATIHALGRKV